jgi:hypothetical protein
MPRRVGEAGARGPHHRHFRRERGVGGHRRLEAFALRGRQTTLKIVEYGVVAVHVLAPRVPAASTALSHKRARWFKENGACDIFPERRIRIAGAGIAA